MLNFNCLEKGLGIVSPPYFGYDFSRKMFLMLYSIQWPYFIVHLPLLLDLWGDMCIAIVSFLGYDLINFVINLTFLMKLFSYMRKKINFVNNFISLIKPLFYMTKNSIGRIFSTN